MKSEESRSAATPLPPLIDAEPESLLDRAPQYQVRPLAFALLLLGVVCMGMGQTVVFAVLPPIARDLGFADFQVGAIFMLSAVFWVTMGPRWGRLSDAYGRRPFVLIGIGGFTVSMVLFATAIRLGVSGVLSGVGLYVLVLCTRSIYGIIGSAQPPAAQAYIADRTSPEARAKGLAGFTAAFGIGTLLGPAFAGVAVAFGPLAPLYGVAGLAACAFLAILFFLPENNPPRERIERPKIQLRDARIFAFLLYGLVGGAVAAIPVQMIGFYFIDILALSGDEALARVSIALTASSIAALFAQLVLVGRLSVQPRALMRYGPVALALGHGLFAIGSTFWILVAGALFSGLGWGMIAPGFTTAASLSVTPREQGAASGLSNASSAAGFIFAPLLGFGLYAIDPRAPFVMTAIVSGLLIVFAWRNPKISALGARL